jgi:hypothetical protein
MRRSKRRFSFVPKKESVSLFFAGLLANRIVSKVHHMPQRLNEQRRRSATFDSSLSTQKGMHS